MHGRFTINVEDLRLRIPAIMFKNIPMGRRKWIYRFSSDFDLIYEFDLKACLEGSTPEDNRLFFVLYAKLPEETLVYTEVSLVDCNGFVIKSEENEHIFWDIETWKFSGILQPKEMTENGFCLILCIKSVSVIQMRIYNSSVECIQSLSTKPATINVESVEDVSSSFPVTVLLQELLCLYQDQDFSDFQLKCGDVSFPVHKAILGARSPVFKTMLTSDMKEAASSEVDIEDLDPSTLASFLAFLYTGKVDDLQSDSALKLYYAADKYQVPSLKKVCANYLCAEVTISCVCDMLSLGDKHQDDQLIAVSHDFILKNYKAVLCSEEWKSFMVKEPLLGVKTLTNFAEKNRLGEINVSQ